MFQNKKSIQNKNLQRAASVKDKRYLHVKCSYMRHNVSPPFPLGENFQCALEKRGSENRMNAWRNFKSSCLRYLPADHFNINKTNDKKLNILLIFTILFVYLNIRLIRWTFSDCHLCYLEIFAWGWFSEFSSNYWSWSVFAKQPVNVVLMILKDRCMIKRTKGFIGYIFLSHIGFLQRFSSQPQFTVWIF